MLEDTPFYSPALRLQVIFTQRTRHGGSIESLDLRRFFQKLGAFLAALPHATQVTMTQFTLQILELLG